MEGHAGLNDPYRSGKSQTAMSDLAAHLSHIVRARSTGLGTLPNSTNDCCPSACFSFAIADKNQ
jgi:hypothetical protein